MGGDEKALVVDEDDIVDSAATDSDVLDFTVGTSPLVGFAFAGLPTETNGGEISWAYGSGDTDTTVLEGTTVEDGVAIRLTVTPVSPDGLANGQAQIDVELLADLTHVAPLTGAVENGLAGLIGVTVVATDADGKTATGTATVDVVDDIPVFTNVPNQDTGLT